MVSARSMRRTPPVFEDLSAKPESTLVAGFTLVAKRGDVGDWAVYYGPREWSEDQIMREGEKLPREAAIRMFPSIKGPYRD